MFECIILLLTPVGKALIAVEIAVISILALLLVAMVIRIKKDAKNNARSDNEFCEDGEEERDELFEKVYAEDLKEGPDNCEQEQSQSEPRSIAGDQSADNTSETDAVEETENESGGETFISRDFNKK